MSAKRLILLVFLSISIQVFAQSNVRYQLNSIKFTGNYSFSSSTLSEQIYSKTTPWWFWKFLHSFSSFGKAPVYFDSTNISLDIQAIKDYYKSNGYFNTEVGYKYLVDTAGKSVDLIYNIKENAMSTFGKLNLLGLDNVPKYLYTNLYKEVASDTNMRYSESLVENNTTKVINFLLDNGYMFARWDTTVVMVDTVKDKANVNMYFNTGKRYSIDTVLIQKSGVGANLVTDGLLRDISGIHTGDIYNLEELRRSQVRLYRTGLFNTVILSAVDKDTTDSKVPIRLNGNIGLMNELAPEVIVNNQHSAFNVGLGFSFIQKNFLGDARKLTISSSFGVQKIFNLDIGHLINHFSFRDTTLLGYVDSRVTIDQPYLFEKPIFGTWETYATINKQPDYNNTLYGTKFTLEFELPTYTFINHLSTTYTLEQSNELYRVYHDSISTKLVSDIALDAASTTANNILFPTSGYNLTFHLEEGNSFPQVNSSEADFYKILLGASYYITLDKHQNSIGAFKLKIGDIQIFYGSFAGVPINRTFYAGGSTSIRGWGSNQLVPEGSQVVTAITGVKNFKGGTFLIDGSMEFRRKFLEDFGYALFFDYGNTWMGYHQLSWNGIAVATGFGFRYYTPIAPFRIDFGFKFYDPANREFLWQKKEHVLQHVVINFGIGEAF